MSDFQRVKEDSNGNLMTGDESAIAINEDPDVKESKNVTASVAAEVSAKVADNRERLRQGKKPKKGAEDLKQEITMDEHLIPLEELFSRYNTSLESGMSSSVAEREAEAKPNKLTPPKETPKIVKFLKILFGGFAMLLWVGGVLCFIAYGIESSTNEDVTNDNLYLGVVLVAVVLITGIFSYYQEAKSDAVMAGFLKMQPQASRVLRDGKWKGIDATELVCGDIVEITFGNVVPADVRIITSNGFKIDNSSITGEPDALLRSNECTDDNPLESKNVAFYSTNAVEGTAKAIVVRTGDDTFMGIIASLVANTKKKDTPLNKEIAHFIHLITVIAVLLGVTFFILAIVVQGYYWLDAVIFLIGIIVANVPEGLLATVTVSLTLTARRLASKNVLVKNLEAVETLGSTSCICSDKTGTLTQNRMTVNHLWYDNKIWAVDHTVEGCFKKDDPSFKRMYDIACLNSRAEFDEEDTSKRILDWVTIGDASESALIKFCEAVRPIEEARAASPKAAEIPFNSSNKYAVSICEQENSDDERYILYMKGAPERVLDRCTHMMINGEEVEMTTKIKDDYDLAYNALGGQGERVLGFAYMYLDAKQFPRGFAFDIDNVNFPLEGLCYAGLYALIDPPRPAVPSSVRECQSAGIRVIMVTGDHPITARAIARQVNIIRDDTADEMAEKQGIPVEEINKDDVKAIVINGTMLKDMEDEELRDILRHYQQIVFARTSPQQKLIIVEAVQFVGNVVAVTGDGVNDSPALRQADIGVAMGIAGTDVSKAAADMILLDDDFSSIVKGVEEGRLIFDNLKKSIAYTLTSNIPEITPFLFFIMLDIPLPLSTIMILCIDLGTDMYPAISLAYEQPESDIMKRKPRDAKHDNLVNAKLLQMTYLQIGVIQAMAGFFNYFVVFGDHGFLPTKLFGIREPFDDKNNQSVQDSYGQLWDFESRVDLLQMSNTAFLLAIIEVQWADLIICKTRMLSVVHQGMRNVNLNFSLVFETVLAIIIIYVPGFDVAFTTRPLRFVYWLPAIPFSCVILIFDECRKFFIRMYPGGWVFKEFYY